MYGRRATSRRRFLAAVAGSVVLASGCTAPTAGGPSSPMAGPDSEGHMGCQPGEVRKDGTCQVAVSEQNADIFRADGLMAITASDTTLDGTPGYLARPDDDGTYPAVLMIHEWWGLNDNIRHMADILAGHGYVVFAVDLYDGEVATDSSRAGQLAGSVRNNPEEALSKMDRAVGALRARPEATDRVTSLGWCFGGGQSLQLSLSETELDATVIYYGSLTTDEAELRNIDGPVLGIFGEADTSIPVGTVREFERTLEELGVDHEIHVYDGAPHAFANPSSERFHPEATMDAWGKTLDFLERHLRE